MGEDEGNSRAAELKAGSRRFKESTGQNDRHDKDARPEDQHGWILRKLKLPTQQTQTLARPRSSLPGHYGKEA